MKLMPSAILAILVALPATAQQQPNPNQPFPQWEVDQMKVDKAIEKGVAHLKAGDHTALRKHAERDVSDCELVLYTYVHAGVPQDDPAFKTLFDDMIKRQMQATYCVSLQAMILEDLDRVKWQKRIAACAQFLLDNQCTNGQWTYGSPSIYVEEMDATPTGGTKKDVPSGPGGDKVKSFESLPPAHGLKQKPKVGKHIKVEKKRDGPAGGDNSNTQYAALGLRACHDAGIDLPPAVIDKAMTWWRTSQKEDKDAKPEKLIEGGVNGPEVPKGPVGGGTVAGARVTEVQAAPQGWCYGAHADHKAYGSMSAGAIGSLAIYNYIKDNDEGKKRSWKKDKDAHEGLVWLAKNFSVTGNPGPYEHGGMAENSKHQYYYYLYGLERAGMLYGTEVIGTHKWYPEGAKVLIEAQAAGGQWGDGVHDTCFAILFLKRATAPLGVETHSVSSKR